MLPNLNYANDFWDLETDPETLLLYQSNSNGLVFYPGYSNLVKISRVIVPEGFGYRRIQSHTILLDVPVRLAARVKGNSIEGLIAFKAANVVYTQTNPQLSQVDLSPQILATKSFKNFGLKDLWDAEDEWFVSEQSLSTPFSISYSGNPTLAEKLWVSKYVINEEGTANVERVPTLKPSVDYRKFRPLDPTSDLKPPPLELIQLYSENQLTIEDLLKPAILKITSGQQPFQSIDSNAYSTKTFPASVFDPTKHVTTSIDLLLKDCSRFIQL